MYAFDGYDGAPKAGFPVGIVGASSTTTLVEGCSVYDNGIEGSIYHHNSYTAAIGIVFQYNYYGPLRSGCDGNNLKDRSAGTVVRYNISVNDGLRTIGKHAGFSPTFHISGPVQDTHIYNNVIYINRKPMGRVDRTLLKMDNWGGPWPVDTRFTNNIFYNQEWTEYDYGKAVGTIFDNNVYYGS